jgi:hypothetical protein
MHQKQPPAKVAVSVLGRQRAAVVKEKSRLIRMIGRVGFT